MTARTAPPDGEEIAARALGVLGVGDDAPAWAGEIAARFMAAQTPRCKHLRRRPRQYGVLAMSEGFARCGPCAERHAATIQDPAPGAFGAAADSRVECLRCHGWFVVGRVTPLCILGLPWGLYGAICGPCEAREGVAGLE